MKSYNEDLKVILIEEDNVRLKTLIEGRTAKGASSCLLGAMPNIFTKSKFDKASFQMMIKYSLGVSIVKKSHACPDCGVIMDKFGEHAMTCRVSSARIAKHNCLVDIIANTVKNCGITTSANKHFMPSDNREMPGVIFISDFDLLGDAYFDVSVINILCPSYLQKSSKGALCGSDIRYEEKKKKYPALGGQLKPLIVECTGGWNSFSFKYLKMIAELVASRKNQSVKKIMKTLLSSLSVSLQRQQGAMLVRRCLSLA